MDTYTGYVWDQNSQRWITLGGGGSSNFNMYYDTVANWNVKTDLISENNAIYVYSDYRSEFDYEKNTNVYIPNIKIGDGTTRLIILPFLVDDFATMEYVDNVVQNFIQHINNTTVHITQEEREFWNNKHRAFYSAVDNDTLVFTKD